ncbi:MAG: cytochrome c3 family protein [Acidobacteria bacterium]|nr:cytochrome c3 family protein [Acidobacteriota bacterium]
MTNKRGWIITILVLVVLLTTAAWLAKARSYAPEQPIAFSHQVHVTDYKIDCLYCHSYAPRSPFAGVPSVERCMGCHQVVAGDKPEVKKLKEYWDRSEPIPWNKVYVLPRFVRFNHEAHVRAAVGCQECHGAVESMTKIIKVNSLEMGWCLDCHNARHASVDCLVCHY